MKISIILFTSVFIVVLEVVQAYIFFDILFAFMDGDREIDPFISVAGLLVVIFFYFIFSFAHNIFSQEIVAHRFAENFLISLNARSYREAPRISKDYYSKYAFEVLVRAGFGVFSAGAFAAVRLGAAALMLAYVAWVDWRVAGGLILLGLPVGTLVAIISLSQRRFGTYISHWNGEIAALTSKTLALLVVGDLADARAFQSSERRVVFANALSQTFSSISRPLIELVVALAIVAWAVTDGQTVSADPGLLAILYRIYGNGTAAVSLVNLISSSWPSLRNLQKPEVRRETRLDDGVYKMVFDEDGIPYPRGGVEIRGPSGAGKTVALESIVRLVRSQSRTAFMWIPSQEIPDISIRELVMSVAGSEVYAATLAIKDELPKVNLEGAFSSLSLGEKARMGIILAGYSTHTVVALDEPFANLDETSRLKMQDLIQSYTDKKFVLITSHTLPIPGFLTYEISQRPC